jgi:hypothetical protein
MPKTPLMQNPPATALKQKSEARKGPAMFRNLTTTAFLTAFLAGCQGPIPQTEPLFKDVQREPPLMQAETVEYLVRNDRPMAEWVEETAQACDEYGCRP